MRWRPLLLVAALVSCGRESAREDAASTPLPMTAARLRELSWLEGRWRGTESGTGAFFEAYRFVNDSLIRSYSYDSTGRTITDSGAITLSEGIVSTGDSSVRWVLTALDSVSAHFEPVRGAINTFTWTKVKGGGWTATLSVPGGGDTVRSRVYDMQPVP